MIIRPSEEFRLRARSLNRGLFNTTTLRRRRFDGFIASMQQSGSHWLKYMLGLTLAKIYDLPPPSHIQDDSIIGHTRSPPIYPGIPQIIHSHSIPHYFLRSRALVAILHFPRYVVLVRDIRDGLVAHYEKFNGEYNVDFSTFLHGGVRRKRNAASGRKYADDIWLRIRFLNGWGAVAERHPERVAVLRYEDLKADTRSELARVCNHLVSPQIIHSHSIPHYFLRSRALVAILHFPRYVVLVRDIRDGLVAHYEKFNGEYNVDFSTFLHGGVRRKRNAASGRKYADDIWVRLRFLNGWGAVIERQPEHAAVVTYEELLSDTPGQLARVCDYFNIEGVTPDLLDEVVALASKEEMAKLPNPKVNRIVVRTDPRPSNDWYSDADRSFVAEVCRRNLKYTFGYKYW